MSAAPTKFCVDCVFHVLVLGSEGHLWWKRSTLEHRCTAFQKDFVSPVTGETRAEYADIPCDVSRDNPRICGPEGARWEAKP